MAAPRPAIAGMFAAMTLAVSRGLMEWIECESLWFGCPDFADVFVRPEAFEGLQPSGKIISFDEIFKVLTELLMALVIEALAGRFLDGPVHSLDLTSAGFSNEPRSPEPQASSAVRPGVLRFGQPMVDIVPCTGEFEGMGAEALLL